MSFLNEKQLCETVSWCESAIYGWVWCAAVRSGVMWFAMAWCGKDFS